MNTQPATPSEAPATLDRRWLTLQIATAAGIVITVVGIFTVVIQRVEIPLVVAAVLFLLPLGLATRRPRAAVIAVGVVSLLWFITQVVNVGRVLPELTNPQLPMTFLPTFAFIVVPVAGMVGLFAGGGGGKERLPLGR